MIDHIGVPVTDIARSRTFYEAALAPLGIRALRVETNSLGNTAVLMEAEEAMFVLADGEPVTPGLHIAFRARTSGAVDSFHRAAIDAGGTDNGAPGLRPEYEGRYYAAFVIDPDGMNIEVVCHLEKRDDDLHHRL